MILVYRYRVKSLNGLLNQQARAVNFVWNFCNDRQKDALRFGRRWHTGFDLNKLTAGASRELGLHSGTVNAVCEQYAKSRSQNNPDLLVQQALLQVLQPLIDPTFSESSYGFRPGRSGSGVWPQVPWLLPSAVVRRYGQDRCGPQGARHVQATHQVHHTPGWWTKHGASG